MLARQVQILGDSFKLGFRVQKTWGQSFATAFFWGEAGAGLYFVAQFFNFLPGMAIGLLMVIFGKGGGHLLHLGQPLRGWRAFAKIGSSWISRGLAAIGIFSIFGSIHALDLYSGGILPAALSGLVSLVAVLACLVIMVYQGFAMSHSTSIALWSTGLMPLASLTYALLNGVLLTLVLGYNTTLLNGHPETAHLLQVLAMGLMLYGFVMVLSLVHGAKYGSEGGQASSQLLLAGAMAGLFLPVVMGLGFVVSALVIAFLPQGMTMLVVVAGTELTGYYAFRVLMFKAAIYDPVMSFQPHFKR